MAKTEIEERAWSDPRLKTVARRLKAGRGEVLGWLVGIWHDSQQLGLEAASVDDIEAWMEVGPKYRAADVRAALTAEGYLEPLPDGRVRIDGNSWRIKRTQARVASAKAAISARWTKDSNTNRIPNEYDSNDLRIPNRETDRQVDSKTERQANSSKVPAAHVINAGAHNAGARVDDPPPAEPSVPKPRRSAKLTNHSSSNLPEATTDGSQVWNAYARAYQLCYGHQPVRNAKTNGLCAQLVKRLGVDDAMKVVSFYLTCRKSYYVSKVHQLEPCVSDAEGLRTQMMAGHRVTSTDARRVDEGQTNAQAFAAVEAKLKREGVL